MTRPTKTIIVIAGALVLLLVAFVLVVPSLVNLEGVKGKIAGHVSEAVGGHVDYETMTLSLVPRPRVTLRRMAVSIPGKIEGRVNRIRVCPKLIPLLWGHVHLAGVEVDTPDVTLFLTEPARQEDKQPRDWSPAAIQEEVRSIFGQVLQNIPEMVAAIENGVLSLVEGNEPVMRLEEVNGDLAWSPTRLTFDLRCTAAPCEKASVRGLMDPRDFQGGINVELTDLRPHLLPNMLLPVPTVAIGDAQINVKVRVDTEGFEKTHADVEVVAPSVIVQKRGATTAISGTILRGTVEIDGSTIAATLTELSCTHPRMRAFGAFRADSAVPGIALQLEGRDIDIGEMRTVALVVADEVPPIREVFNVVRDGVVSVVKIRTQGPRLADLLDSGNASIDVSVMEGKLFVEGEKIGFSGGDANVEDIRADVTLSGKMVEATNVAARWENARVADGTVRLGLEGGDGPLYAKIMVDADLSQISLLLTRVLRKETPLYDIVARPVMKGKARGQVTVGGRLDSPEFVVDGVDAWIVADIPWIPHRLEIQTGRVRYSPETIGLKGLKGRFGGSSFSDLTGTLSLGASLMFNVESFRSSIVLDEIVPWLRSFEEVKAILKDISSITGTLSVAELTAEGSVSELDKIRFRMVGAVQNVAVESPQLPAPVEAVRGTFEIDPGAITLGSVQLNVFDASVELSGRVDGYQRDVERVDIGVQGSVGLDALHMIEDKLNLLPLGLSLRQPLVISQSRLRWGPGGAVSFAGNLTMEDRTRVSLDVGLDPTQLAVREMIIEDKDTRASLALEVSRDIIGFSFSGYLNERTLDNMIVGRSFGNGWVRGEFRTRLVLDEPVKSTAEGTLEVTDYTLVTAEVESPIEVEHIMIQGGGTAIAVRSGAVAWQDHRIVLEGDVRADESGLVVDMDAAVDGIDLNRIEKDFRSGPDEADFDLAPDIWDLPLQGTVRLRSDYLRYGPLTWAPFNVDVSLGSKVLKADIKEGRVCEIATPGVIEMTPDTVSLRVNLDAEGAEVNPVILCLSEREVGMTGSFDLAARIEGKGTPEELPRAVNGEVQFEARNGRIRQLQMLSNILAFVNLTELFRGKVPDLGKEGFRYNSLTVRADLEDGKLLVREAVLDASSMEIVSEGVVDLLEDRVDLRVLVAPLKTVDFVVKMIPGLTHILGGTLVSVPIRVSRDFSNPQVTPLSPSAVGAGLLGVMKRTLELPIKIVEPVVPSQTPSGSPSE